MLELKYCPEFPLEIIAVDEVGRGPLGGPVVIGAVRLIAEDADSLKTLGKFLRTRNIRDSKLLTEAERTTALTKLGIVDKGFREKSLVTLKGIEVSFITWDMDHERIDELNILGASLEGMRQSALELSDAKNLSTIVFIDGHLKLRWGKMSAPWTEVPVVKGDSKSALIGLASIIAKQKRDAFMREMHELYPQYGFATHFGYPTPEHRRAIREFGPCPIHRKSFKGVKEFVGALA